MTDASSSAPELPAEVCELERFLARRRAITSRFLTLDAEERWGHPNAARAAEMDREHAANGAMLAEAEAEIARRVGDLRSRAPKALEAWIAAQEHLLDAYLLELDRRPDPERVRTERFVALGERKAWAEVRAGKKVFVDQNAFYVRLPRLLYRALFGFDP